MNRARQVDVSLAVGALVIVAVWSVTWSGESLDPLGWAAAVVSSAALIFRRARPVLVATAILVVCAGCYPLSDVDGAIWPALVVALYTAAAQSEVLRIARELHDALGHSLSVIHVQRPQHRRPLPTCGPTPPTAQATRTTCSTGTPPAYATLVLDRIADWAPALRTLVGDAIHSMTPMAGVGADTALRDAAELTLALAATPDPVAAITAYENTMRAYANDAPRISLRNARSAASPARLPRHAFRTLFRLADNIPPIKRAMFTTP